MGTLEERDNCPGMAAEGRMVGRDRAAVPPVGVVAGLHRVAEHRGQPVADIAPRLIDWWECPF